MLIYVDYHFIKGPLQTVTVTVSGGRPKLYGLPFVLMGLLLGHLGHVLERDLGAPVAEAPQSVK